MELTKLSLRVDNGIARLAFINGARGNPIDAILCTELSEAAVLLSEDRSVRVVLITAEGTAFSYGGDIAAFIDNLDELPKNIKRFTTSFHSAIARLQRMDAPMVVAVHGVCAGGMGSFVAGADIVVASDAARFVAAYTGIGFNCDGGATIMYTRRMGPARARKFLLLNEVLDAPGALVAGLADEVCAPADLMPRAEAIVAQLAAGPTKAYGELRRLFNTVQEQPLETQLELEAQALARCTATADAREGLTAFLQRRNPIFVGA